MYPLSISVATSPGRVAPTQSSHVHLHTYPKHMPNPTYQRSCEVKLFHQIKDFESASSTMQDVAAMLCVARRDAGWRKLQAMQPMSKVGVA